MGGLVVAAERSPADAGTLWAATNFGRIFVAKNADGPAARRAVRPHRHAVNADALHHANCRRQEQSERRRDLVLGFQRDHAVDAGPYSAAVYDPVSQTASFTILDADLGDIPINTIAVDSVLNDLYAATDFGPLLLRQGSSTWEIAGVGFPEVLMVDLKIVSDQRLLIAATHGLGIFYMRLPGGVRRRRDANADADADADADAQDPC